MNSLPYLCHKNDCESLFSNTTLLVTIKINIKRYQSAMLALAFIFKIAAIMSVYVACKNDVNFYYMCTANEILFTKNVKSLVKLHAR